MYNTICPYEALRESTQTGIVKGKIQQNRESSLIGNIQLHKCPGAHWEQGKGHFSSLGQKLNFEIWFFAFWHFILTPWGPQISFLKFQK